MDKAIVITTINPPKKEVAKFSQLDGWKVVCVGDTKTPSDWRMSGTTYLPPTKQRGSFPRLANLIRWRHYARKNLGYLYAMKQGCKIIAETDDDVYPLKNYPPDISKRKKISVLSGAKFINIYKLFGGGNSWPRGFPLNYLSNKEKVKKITKKVFAPIQTSLIDQDSDFDAIYRLVSNKSIVFRKNGEFALARGSYCPFNTQNTFFYPEAYLLLYVPSCVDMRIADIWRGYIAQRVLWELGGNLVFIHATTSTKSRNLHDFVKDFSSEIPLFTQTEALVKILDSISLCKDLGKSLIKIYKQLVKAGIMNKNEIKIVEAWSKTVESITKARD